MLSLALRLALLPLLLAFLAACDPRPEEEVTSRLAQETSAEEIIRAVLEAEKSIDSVQVEETQTSAQFEVTPPDNEVEQVPQEYRSLRIQVGDDYYSKHTFVLPPGFCEAAQPGCGDAFSPLDETLLYDGNFYFRDSSGARWVSALERQSGCTDTEDGSSCVGTGGFVETAARPLIGEIVDCPALDSLYESGPSDIYAFDFSRLSDVERPSEAKGDGLIHLRGVVSEPLWTFDLPPEVQAAYAECGIEPPDVDPDGEMPDWIREYTPERVEGTVDIWVNPATFHVHRIDQHLRYFKGDRLLQSDDRSSVFSLFNEATLPGPLPE